MISNLAIFCPEWVKYDERDKRADTAAGWVQLSHKMQDSYSVLTAWFKMSYMCKNTPNVVLANVLEFTAEIVGYKTLPTKEADRL